MKRKLCTPPVLVYPNFDEQVVVESDTSEYSAGAVLSEKDKDGKLHQVQCASWTVNNAENTIL